MNESELALVREIVSRALEQPIVQFTPQSGGLSSHAFNVATSSGRFIARVGNDVAKLAGFKRELHAIQRANEIGIPTQEIVALGQEAGWSYTIAVHLGGDCAVDHPERISVLEKLGQLAARIHTVPTAGFGFNFRCTGKPDGDVISACSSTWLGFLQSELDARGRLERLWQQTMLTDEQLEHLSTTLSEVESWNGSPVLNHGDLRLKNVIVDAEGDILGLIDWETSASCLGPHWDLSIALHDLGIDAKQSFLRGFGLPEDDVRRAIPVWRLFNVLNYAPAVSELVQQGDQVALDQMRTRLSGGLELFGASR